MAKQLELKDQHLLQEPENKFTLQEMWEVAFHELSALKPREAYTLIKGAMEHPEKIRTLDNPGALPKAFAFGDSYRKMNELLESSRQRQAELDQRIEAYLDGKEDMRSGRATETGLGFVDKE